MKKNFLPGIGLQMVSLTLVLCYYLTDPVNNFFTKIASVKSDLGYLFSFISTFIFGGLIPFCVLFLRDAVSGSTPLSQTQPPEVASGLKSCPEAKPLQGWNFIIANFFYMLVFWGYRGVEVDAFYRLQATMFGSEAKAEVIIPKVLFDQLVYNPFWAIHVMTLPYLFRDSGFSFSIFRSKLGWDYITFRCPSLLLSTWVTWFPAVSVVYAFPSDLQIPLFNFVLCFFCLVVAFVTNKQNKT